MAKKETTPSFIVELPLKTTVEDERLLNDRFLCATRLTNTLMGIGIDMVDTMRASAEWKAACELPKTTKEHKAARVEAFEAVRKAHGFFKANFDHLVKVHAAAGGFNKRIGSHEAQAIAATVFKSLNDWILNKHKRPRFKGEKRKVHSIEGKNNDGMLRWLDNGLQMSRAWRIKAILPDLKKPNQEWLAEALTHRTKYCRIIWRNISGKKLWFVQLIQEGESPIPLKQLRKRFYVRDDAICGIDIGPSELAYATATDADKVRLCPSIDRDEAKIRIIQRQIDRMRRDANPGNYNEDGTVKTGRKTWIKSNRQIEAESTLREIQRKEAATRKKEHGKLANLLLSKAKIFKDDGVSAKSLQRNYGKSSSKRASGLMMSILERKAERAGGKRIIINARQLKNSQYDHTTNTFKKKPLSQRKHVFGDGRGYVDRDVYSAFLARVCDETTYNPSDAEEAWGVLEEALLQSGLFVPDATRGNGETSSLSDTAGKQIHPGTVATPSESFGCEMIRQPADFSLKTDSV